MAAEYDRTNPLFERNSVPFEIIATPSPQGGNGVQNAGAATTNKRHGNFTVRILQGHRSSRNGGDRERVIRFEMSDECNLTDDHSDARAGNTNSGIGQGTPIRRTGTLPHQTPNVPIIHAPFMTVDRGRAGPSVMQSQGHRHTMDASSSLGGLPAQRSMPNRPIELYELEVGESDFSDLRRDQALLVDFNDFANSLISLLKFCELGEDDSSQSQEQGSAHHAFHDATPFGQKRSDFSGGWNSQTSQPMGHQYGAWNTPFQPQQHWDTPSQPQQQRLNQQMHGIQYQGPRVSSPYGKMNSAMPVSTYTCRLETNSPAPSGDGAQWRSAPKSTASLHARFSVVESNQFRELTHLALNLNIGTDKTVRLYLSSRLSQIMMENKHFQFLHAEQTRRSDTAESELICLNKRLQELTQSSQTEKSQIYHQQNAGRLAEVNEVKATKEAEIKALKEGSERNQALLENKIRVLEDVNSKINAEKTACQNEKERLGTKLSYQETTNNTLTNELTSLRSQLQQVSHEKSTAEKNLHQLQLQLSSLEYSNTNQEKTISQTEAQRISAEKESTNARQTVMRQQSEMEELRRRLEHAELETSKYKDLTNRYQTDRLEMKKRMKEKVETIRQQEDALATRGKETMELKHRVRRLEENLQQMRGEKETACRELRDAKQQTEDDKKKLENNQQVKDLIVCTTIFVQTLLLPGLSHYPTNQLAGHCVVEQASE